MVAKTDDDAYALSIIEIYSYFSFVFPVFAKEGRVVENIDSDVATLKILTSMQKP